MNAHSNTTRLSSVTQSCGYKLRDVAPDGNCCFAAVAFSLLTQLTKYYLTSNACLLYGETTSNTVLSSGTGSNFARNSGERMAEKST